MSNLFRESILFPGQRLDWFGLGPGTENVTGSFIAMLMVFCWVFALLNRRFGFWASLTIFAVLGVFLVQTESRGGFVGLFLGLLLVVCSGRLFWNAAKILAFLLILALLAWYSHDIGYGGRITEGIAIQDGSSQVRLSLYKAGVRMIVDAPSGWGEGQSARIYQNWYQKIGDDRTYTSLVNTHLTWMSEFGLYFQLFYVMAIALCLVVTFPQKRSPLLVLGSGCWVCYLVCAFFSSIGTFWGIWLVPAITLLCALTARWKLKLYPSKGIVGLIGGSAFASLFCLYGMGWWFLGGVDVRGGRSFVVVGNPSARPVVYAPDTRVLGQYGHTIRDYIETDELDGLSVAYDVSGLEKLGEKDFFLFSGHIDWEVLRQCDPANIILLNPRNVINSKDVSLFEEKRMRVYFGEFADWRYVDSWRDIVELSDAIELVVLQGVGDYIAYWPELLNEF